METTTVSIIVPVFNVKKIPAKMSGFYSGTDSSSTGSHFD